MVTTEVVSSPQKRNTSWWNVESNSYGGGLIPAVVTTTEA
jgi:hypothetical protein